MKEMTRARMGHGPTTCTYVHKYIHTCIHTCMHTYIHSLIHTFIHSFIRTYTHAYKHTYIYTCIQHTYIHTYTHAYTHAYIRTYIHAQVHICKSTYYTRAGEPASATNEGGSRCQAACGSWAKRGTGKVSEMIRSVRKIQQNRAVIAGPGFVSARRTPP